MNVNGFINLPSIDNCKRLFQSIAILDAIIMPEWEYRYYSFNSKWDTSTMMASMRDGSGNHYFAYFNEFGLIIKGFEKHAVSSQLLAQPQLIFKGVPKEFDEFLSEPAFIINEMTFCIWNLRYDEVWHSAIEYRTDEIRLLSIINEGAEGYVKWANEYFEINLDIDIVHDIFNFKPLSNNLVRKINGDIFIEDILEDIEEINYPIEN